MKSKMFAFEYMYKLQGKSMCFILPLTIFEYYRKVDPNMFKSYSKGTEPAEGDRVVHIQGVSIKRLTVFNI